MAITSANQPRSTRWRHTASTALLWIYIPIGITTWIPGLSTNRILNTILAVAVTQTALARYWHTRELCERCISSLPLNAAERAARYRWLLRIAHARRLQIGTAIVLVVAGWPLNKAGLLSHCVSTVLTVAMAVVGLASMKHNRLQPWCPYCRNDGGGDDEVVPDPTGGKGLPVPVAS